MSAPTGPAPIGPTGLFEGLRPRAILVGVVVDNVVTLVAYSALLAALLAWHGIDLTEDVPDEKLDSVFAGPEALALGLLVGGLATVLGGWVGARMGGRHFVRHGAFVGGGSLLLGLVALLAFPPEPSEPLWIEIVVLLAMVPLGALGGQLEAWRASRPGA